MKRILLAVLLSVLAIVPVSCADPTEGGGDAGYWPREEWRISTPEAQGMDSAVLADMYDAIVQSGKQIDSITIIRNGYLVNEAYFFPYQKGLMHSLNSGTKCLLSAVAGMAVDEGKISLGDAVLDYFPDAANVDERKQAMTVGDLMSMQTGLDWQFDGNVSTIDMLGSGNWAQFTLDLPMKEEPGQRFLYCNGAAEVMSSIVRDMAGENAEEVFRGMDIGIGDMYWAVNPEGANQGYSGAFMQPDDMARFGYLYLMEGNWNGRQVISKEWIEESTKTHAQGDWSELLPRYGYFWWVPEFGGYCALSHGGNYIFVVPDQQMVAVFTGGIFDLGEIFYPVVLMRDYVLPSVKSDEPLPDNPAAAKVLQNAVDSVQNPPPPQPLAPLPAIAEQISGKTYAFEGSRDLKIIFDGTDTFTIVEGGQYTYTVGLDGVYRINDVRDSMGMLPDHNHRAFKGRWIDDQTLEVVTHELEDGFETVYTCRFEGNQVEMTLTRAAFGQQMTLTGRTAE